MFCTVCQTINTNEQELARLQTENADSIVIIKAGGQKVLGRRRLKKT